jgi:hypothetical protein
VAVVDVDDDVRGRPNQYAQIQGSSEHAEIVRAASAPDQPPVLFVKGAVTWRAAERNDGPELSPRAVRNGTPAERWRIITAGPDVSSATLVTMATSPLCLLSQVKRGRNGRKVDGDLLHYRGSS